MYKQRALWAKLVNDPFLYPQADNRTRPAKFATLQYQGCKPPWTGSRKLVRSDVILLKEYVSGDRRKAVVSPFVVSRPGWLVGSRTARAHEQHSLTTRPAAVPWQSRKLIFFAGNVPKPYIRPTRYLLWRQMRQDPRVTAISSTLSCHVGTFARCSWSEAFLRAQNNSFWLTHCHTFCGTKTTCMSSARRTARGNMQGFLKACGRMRGPRLMRNANFTEELPAMLRDTRRVSHGEYLSLAMSHRFCLIAPGDWVSTHKVTEAMALGGAGGCIPVFVAPGSSLDDIEAAVPGMLPYTRWHDYCRTSYFVSEYSARLNFSTALDRLSQVSEVEAAQKLQALRDVRDAFVFRPGSSLPMPSAPEFILGDACAAAARQKEQQNAAGRSPRVLGQSHALPPPALRSCFLG